MNTRRNVVAGCLVAMAAVALMATGCTQATPELYKVSGVLTHEGAPIADMEVIFLPDDTKTNRESLAVTDSEGKFVMMLSSHEGVAPGGHTVYVRDPAAMQGFETNDDPAYLAVIKKYGDETTSPMKLTVDSDLIDYELKLD